MKKAKRKAKKGHGDGLAYLRTIGIILVLLSHMGESFASALPLGVCILLVAAGHAMAQTAVFEINKGTFSIVRFYRRQLLPYIFPALAVMLSSVGLATIFEKRRMAHIALEFAMDMLGVGNFLLIFDSRHHFLVTLGNSPLMHMGYAAIFIQFALAWPLVCLAYAKVKEGLGTGDGIILMAIFTLWSFTFPTMRMIFRPDTSETVLRFDTAIQLHALFCGAFMGVLGAEGVSPLAIIDAPTVNMVSALYVPLLGCIMALYKNRSLAYMIVACMATTFMVGVLSCIKEKKTVVPDNPLTFFVDSIACEAFLLHHPICYFLDKAHPAHGAWHAAVSLALIISLSIYLRKLTGIARNLLG